ncbi:MAG: hypothetical protein ABJC55_12925, partial [Algoriphagus sp.]
FGRSDITRKDNGSQKREEGKEVKIKFDRLRGHWVMGRVRFLWVTLIPNTNHLTSTKKAVSSLKQPLV